MRVLLRWFCWSLAITVLQGEAVAEPEAPVFAASDDPEGAIDEAKHAEAAREREQSAENDPLLTRQAEKAEKIVEKKAEAVEAPAEPVRRWSFSWYASPRLRYQVSSSEDALSDDVSRAGITADWAITPSYEVFTGLELGFDVFDTLSYWTHPDSQPPERREGDAVFDRLHYVGLDAPELLVVHGKNWSPYYRVAAFTDRFDGAGGEASGVYNAGTDGGATGTGRADNATQLRWLINFLTGTFGLKPFNLNIQYQAGESIPRVPEARYQWSAAASAVIEHSNELAFGIAFNHAEVREDDLPQLEAFGITGDAEILLMGAKWFNDKSYLSATYARSSNHETTDKGIYYDANGVELYVQRQVYHKIWAVGGWNYLKPRGDLQDKTGDYEVNVGIFGARYLMDDFNRMFYIEYQVRSGENQAGEGRGDIFTIGLRWDFPANRG